MTRSEVVRAVFMGVLVGFGAIQQTCCSEPVEGYEYRKPGSEAELRYWLQNMVWYYGFSVEEIEAATGLGAEEIRSNLEKFRITPETKPARAKDASLVMLPWPGGRAVSNWGGEVEQTRQRETKVGVFAPWDDTSFVVLDVPEAIHSNLGFIYLAHVHVETVWTKANVKLDKLEWNRRADGSLDLTRELPNGVVYSAKFISFRNAVRMKLTLTNGTDATLSKLRVQNCIFLKNLKGFNKNTKIVTVKPYNAQGTADGTRWVITAWLPGGLTWSNPKNPCFHSDPIFEDCPPDQTRVVYGWFSFYQGEDIKGEFERIDKTGWREDKWKNNPGWSEACERYR